MATELPLKLPKLVFVDDYHEFKHLQEQLRDLVGAGADLLRVDEVGFGQRDTHHNQYIGIVYTERDDDYNSLVKEAKEWPEKERTPGQVGF